jgi:hypothetical protein
MTHDDGIVMNGAPEFVSGSSARSAISQNPDSRAQKLFATLCTEYPCAMNWRRGALLAAFNLAVALPPTIWLESTEAAFVRGHEQYARKTPTKAPTQAPSTSGQMVTFDPCGWTDAYSVQQEVVGLANIPAEVLGGWRDLCPAHWTLSGMLHASDGWARNSTALVARRKADIGFLLLVAFQWMLVGGLPLRHSVRLWGEPGMFITICATLSVAVVFIRPLDTLAKLLGLLAAFGWFWWFGLLVWQFARFAWKWVTRRLATNAV